MYCKKCGTKIDSKDNYCIKCGAKIIKNPSPNPKTNNIILIAVILLVVFITIIRVVTFIKSYQSIMNDYNQKSSTYNNNNNNYNYDYNYDDSPSSDYYDYDNKDDYYNNEKSNYNFNTITVDDYLKLKAEDKTSIIYIGRNSCRACIQEEIILYTISKKFDITINYLNISNITTQDYEKLQSSDEFFQNNWSIPLILLVKNNKIIEKLEGMQSINQLLEILKNNDLLKEN